MLNDSNWASSLFGGTLFGSGSLFGGHASGGPALAGVPIPVGELGPETFVPSVPGNIVPHSSSMGGTQVINVDARGASDPSSTQASVMRGIKATASAVAYQQSETRRRTPPSRRN
jgi:hypothetical protein